MRPGVRVELMGRYSNPNIVTRLNRILSGSERDRPSHRPVPSLRQKQTRLTDSQRSEVVNRYEAGESASALAAEFGVDRRILAGHLRRAGVAVRYRVVDRVDSAEAARLYSSGRSLEVVAAHLGVSVGTVLRALRSVGVETRPVGTNQWSTS